MSDEIFEAMMTLRAIMFEQVYENPVAKKEEDKAVKMLTELYEYYVEHPESMSAEYREMIRRGEKKTRTVCDYLSGMTDQYSMEKFQGRYTYLKHGKSISRYQKKEDETCAIQTISLKKSE